MMSLPPMCRAALICLGGVVQERLQDVRVGREPAGELRVERLVGLVVDVDQRSQIGQRGLRHFEPGDGRVGMCVHVKPKSEC